MAAEDIWSEWLRHRRFGGDATYQEFSLDRLKKRALKIAEKAEIFESATVLDIGAGDGLVGLTALPKLGAGGKLILSDISEAALAIPKEIFNQKKIQAPRVEFLVAGAENLSSLPDGSVDRVVARSVLLYVEDKQTAFSEIFRVLRPSGRAVLMEPINQRMIEFQNGLFRGYRLNREPLLSVQSLLQRVDDEIKRQTPVSLLDYNEHDLVHLSTNAGFEEIELEYSLMLTSQAGFASWNTFFDAAPNPHARTLREIMTSVLTREEFDRVGIALMKVVQKPGVWARCEALLILKK